MPGNVITIKPPKHAKNDKHIFYLITRVGLHDDIDIDAFEETMLQLRRYVWDMNIKRLNYVGFVAHAKETSMREIQRVVTRIFTKMPIEFVFCKDE
jgi:hypothetical protein